MTAAEKVFGTTELLEAILLELGDISMLDLWKAQHINKHSRAVIRGSHKLASRLFTAVFPAGHVPTPGSVPDFFDDTFFAARLLSQRQGHEWRRKLHLPPRQTVKPEGKIPRLITKCYEAASFLRHVKPKETLREVRETKGEVLEQCWDYRQRYSPDFGMIYDKVEVGYIQDFRVMSPSGRRKKIEVKISASVSIRTGKSMPELSHVIKHLVVAHPFRAKILEGLAHGTEKDPMTVKWRVNGYDIVPGHEKDTELASEIMLGPQTYEAECPARMDWKWRKLQRRDRTSKNTAKQEEGSDNQDIFDDDDALDSRWVITLSSEAPEDPEHGLSERPGKDFNQDMRYQLEAIDSADHIRHAFGAGRLGFSSSGVPRVAHNLS
ncbi:hypothetical protein PRZ48_008944 [Zasmidium cellare]|uniref:Uncharacterized protein n=1 Tax=Zasmidium cellare TaxID=395010 RepID=A0ABR0EGY2_ZASCE|nr:hypothetical protein PRZ48_008944 [Zasmidium cellare]